MTRSISCLSILARSRRHSSVHEQAEVCCPGQADHGSLWTFVLVFEDRYAIVHQVNGSALTNTLTENMGETGKSDNIDRRVEADG